MATSGGPKTKTDDLAFGFDTGYPISDNTTATRFNQGEPTTNLITNSGTSNTGWAGYGWTGAQAISNDYSNTYEFTATNGWHNRTFDTGITSGGTVQVTFEYMLKQQETTQNQLFVLNGTHLGSYTNYIGAGSMTFEWQTFNGTFTANADSKVAIGPRGSDSSGLTDIVYIRNLQVEVKDHVTPFVNGTRSISGSLIDLPRTTDIDLSDMSFDSNAHITFDGTDDSIAIPSTTLGNGNWTVEFVANAHSSGYHMMSNSSGGPVSNAMGVYGNKLYYRNYDGAWQAISSNTTVNYNEIYHLVYVNRYGGSDNSGSMDMYINGEKDSNSGTNSYTTNGGPVNAIGRSWAGYFDGEIYICKRYTTGLSDEEVKQNYNAIKNRFNI